MGHNVVRGDVAVSPGHLTSTAVVEHASFILVGPSRACSLTCAVVVVNILAISHHLSPIASRTVDLLGHGHLIARIVVVVVLC